MSYNRFFQTSFGLGRANLTGIIGYQLFNSNNTSASSRITIGVSETPSGSGIYGALVAVPSSCRGYILWSTAITGGVYASEEINPEDIEKVLSIPTDVDTQLSGIHGAGTWGAGGIGAGIYTHTITLQNTSSGAILGATVTLQDAGTLIPTNWGLTDTLGQITFSVNSGNYKVVINAGLNYVLYTPTTFSVVGNSSQIITLSTQSITPPTNPNVCKIYSWLFLPNGEVAANVSIKFKPTAKNALKLPSAVLDVATITATTNSSGYFETNLVISNNITVTVSTDTVLYRAICAEANLNAVFSVPNQPTVDLRTLL